MEYSKKEKQNWYTEKTEQQQSESKESFPITNNIEQRVDKFFNFKK